MRCLGCQPGVAPSHFANCFRGQILTAADRPRYGGVGEVEREISVVLAHPCNVLGLLVLNQQSNQEKDQKSPAESNKVRVFVTDS